MNDVFEIIDGQVFFQDRGYNLEESVDIINKLLFSINSGVIASAPHPLEEELPRNVINYEDILDKRIISGDNSKSTALLKQWLDNDPDVWEEDGITEEGI